MHALPKIRVPGGTHTLNPQRILETFHIFYEKLYSAENNNNTTHMNAFLDSLPIPTLEDRHQDIMEIQITGDEVLLVIKKQGSVLGPDGFSTPYYKTFVESLALHLARFFNTITKGEPLDRHLISAFISVIPKPNKDQGEVGNYRPISLINNDMKILTKILANRMASFISLYIHKDQVGFILG